LGTSICCRCSPKKKKRKKKKKGNTMRAVLRGKFITVNAYIKKELELITL